MASFFLIQKIDLSLTDREVDSKLLLNTYGVVERSYTIPAQLWRIAAILLRPSCICRPPSILSISPIDSLHTFTSSRIAFSFRHYLSALFYLGPRSRLQFSLIRSNTPNPNSYITNTLEKSKGRDIDEEKEEKGGRGLIEDWKGGYVVLLLWTAPDGCLASNLCFFSFLLPATITDDNYFFSFSLFLFCFSFCFCLFIIWITITTFFFKMFHFLKSSLPPSFPLPWCTPTVPQSRVFFVRDRALLPSSSWKGQSMSMTWYALVHKFVPVTCLVWLMFYHTQVLHLDRPLMLPTFFSFKLKLIRVPLPCLRLFPCRPLIEWFRSFFIKSGGTVSLLPFSLVFCIYAATIIPLLCLFLQEQFHDFWRFSQTSESLNFIEGQRGYKEEQNVSALDWKLVWFDMSCVPTPVNHWPWRCAGRGHAEQVDERADKQAGEGDKDVGSRDTDQHYLPSSQNTFNPIQSSLSKDKYPA